MRTPTRLAALLTALVLALGSASASRGSSGSSARPTAERTVAAHVKIANMAFSPTWIGIDRGRTVVWTNRDTMAHSVVVTSGPVLFKSGRIAPGATFSHTFKRHGRYRYKCGIHPTMRGTVWVR
ncbi:cupredoxin domain-containing protein [Nocardioides montaniterrae]